MAESSTEIVAMGVADTINAIKPLHGRIVPIRTVQETRPPEDYGNAYVAEVNVKASSKVIKDLDAKLPRDPSLPLNHLRRFAKRENLPASLRAELEAKGSLGTGAPTIFVLIAPPLPDTEELLDLLAPYAPDTYGANTSSEEDKPVSKITLVTTTIPLQPPFNAQQAKKWTETMWPVVFNPAAPRLTVAPPPQILNRAQQSIQPRAGYYLALARKVAAEAKASGRGRGVGAVVVDPEIEAEIEAEAAEQGTSNLDSWMDAVLCVGGDVRFARSEAGKPSQTDLHPGVSPNPACSTFDADLEGGPDLHALMRAAELVARCRREDSEHQAEMAAKPSPLSVVHADPQLSSKLSPLESFFLRQAGLPETSSASNAAASITLSPKKRKHEDPNPESTAVPLDSINTDPSTPQPQNETGTPLPAPPPSTLATKTDSSIPVPEIEPASTSEVSTSRIRTRSQGGYLCTDLDIYISHEPCLCCSMGILLSRFRAVIFPRSGRMRSGGLASEPVISPVLDDQDQAQEQVGDDERLYYGLHWRKELNWRALGFEFVEEGQDGEVNEDEGGVVFNA
ncbi:uncharacterized protein N7483_007972 [Penicillium malachiteum]|uniref:uncharacterized protein n=1 Tax=Penicillium malachiteum TaxID=1324776 RepID=UPI002548355B|nr:uncharacterized protein N7483_007972 [Penicillium malachiteum]KAJ5726615.1 hypothetical protein N7483_007972 [Penicillium malachiteum]